MTVHHDGEGRGRARPAASTAGLTRAARLRLAGLLAAAGPDSPTLCEGWTTRDLAAHLVARDASPVAQAGLALPWAAPAAERVRRRLAAGDYGRLVARFRAGPPSLSVFRIPGVEALTNLFEFFVHAEDVARAQATLVRADPAAETLAGHEYAPDLQAALWRALVRAAPVLVRRLRGPVVLVVPGGPRRRVVPLRAPVLVRRGRVDAAGGAPGAVVLTGSVAELAVYLSGRVGHARVEVSGDPRAVAAFDPEDLRGA